MFNHLKNDFLDLFNALSIRLFNWSLYSKEIKRKFRFQIENIKNSLKSLINQSSEDIFSRILIFHGSLIKILQINI